MVEISRSTCVCWSCFDFDIYIDSASPDPHRDGIYLTFHFTNCGYEGNMVVFSRHTPKQGTQAYSWSSAGFGLDYLPSLSNITSTVTCRILRKADDHPVDVLYGNHDGSVPTSEEFFSERWLRDRVNNNERPYSREFPAPRRTNLALFLRASPSWFQRLSWTFL
jgi:hypothetical protein